MRTIGKQIKFFRENLGLSQLDLSQKSNVSQASIARIEADKQKNLKKETIEKFASALGISFSQLMEESSVIREDSAAYTALRMIPVIKPERNEDFQQIVSLIKKSDFHEPSFSKDKNAFFVLINEVLAGDIINIGDMILVEPDVKIREGELALYLSSKQTIIGKVYFHNNIYIIHPLRHESPPISFNRKDMKKNRIHIFRISEIKK